MEKWTDDILNSMDGAKQAIPPTDTFDKIRLKINTQEPDLSSSYKIQLMAVAAAVLIAVCCNLFFVTSYLNSENDIVSETEVEYSEVLTSYSLY